MDSASSLDSVYFITLPEGFQTSKYAAHIDPTVPLPVRRKTKDSPGNFNIKELESEQIFSGILTVLAYDKDNPHLEYYRSILRHARPNIKKELTDLAILKIKNEEFSEAEEIFASLRGFDPDDMGVILNSALMLDQMADFYRRQTLEEEAKACDAQAFGYYSLVMDSDPPVPDAYFNAGFFHLKHRDFENARGCFETYLALTCDISDNALGENGIYKKQRAQAILDDIKNGNMDDKEFKAAYDFISSGQEEEGINHIRLFLERNPHVWNAWFLLGWGLRRLYRYADAKKAFETALQYGGDTNADVYNELAICSMEQKDYMSARRNLAAALRLDSDNVKIISNMGCLSLREGNTAKAKKYFETVLEYEPNDKIAAAELKKLMQ